MPKINGKEITKELLAEAMKCDSPEELMKLGKAHGFEMTAEQAEAYLAEMEDIDLDSAQLKKVAGGFGGKDYENQSCSFDGEGTKCLKLCPGLS